MDETSSTASPGDKRAPDRHVLLVEDEELVAIALYDELKRRGWTVIGPATTLEEAQRLVASGVALDAAILDVNLQGRWAHGIAEELSRRGVPFVACTGYEMVDPDGRFAGAPIITKPIAADRLSDTLDALVEQSVPPPPQIPPAT